MFKQILISLALICLTELVFCNIQLVAPTESYALPKGGKTAINLANSISLTNGLSEEDNSSHGILEVTKEKLASSPATAPASTTRTKPSAVASSISSSTGLSRSSLVISTSAHATSQSSSHPKASARSSTTIQHRILPAEIIPLPITISTRPGLRTVIAPETITIQQPSVARIGEVVQKIPSAVSHQRQTVVHNHARIVTPIVAPAIRTVTSQIVRAYHTPLVYGPQMPTIHVADN